MGWFYFTVALMAVLVLLLVNWIKSYDNGRRQRLWNLQWERERNRQERMIAHAFRDAGVTFRDVLKDPEEPHILFRMGERTLSDQEAAHEKVEGFLNGSGEKVQQLKEQLDRITDELLEQGVSIQIIERWLKGHVHLSHLTITSRYRIILNDFGHLEISMGPLPKTVFLFYLLHPDGIPFARLQDYREEFLRIYGHLTHSDDPGRISASIDRLLDPFDNSINEKCSAVKAAFEAQLSPSVARWYCIGGAAGQPKSIPLDRSLVHWETEI